jgi:hypothetical protein
VIVILPGAERPSAVEAMENGAGYIQINADERGRVVSTTTYRVDLIGHGPCHWDHPTWPDESEERLRRHLETCEMRTTPEVPF